MERGDGAKLLEKSRIDLPDYYWLIDARRCGPRLSKHTRVRYRGYLFSQTHYQGTKPTADLGKFRSSNICPCSKNMKLFPDLEVVSSSWCGFDNFSRAVFVGPIFCAVKSGRTDQHQPLFLSANLWTVVYWRPSFAKKYKPHRGKGQVSN